MFQVSSFKFIIIIYNNLFAIPIDRTGSLTFVFFFNDFCQGLTFSLGPRDPKRIGRAE